MPGSRKPSATFLRQDRRPKLEAERTDYGARNYAIRNAEDGGRYVRINNFIMPNKVANVGNEGRVGEGYTIHWRVPIDDENHVRFDFFFNRARPVARERYEQELATELMREPLPSQQAEPLSTGPRADEDDELQRHGRPLRGARRLRGRVAGADPRPFARASRHHRRLHRGGAPATVAGIASVQAGRDPIHVIRDPAQDDMSHIVVVSEVVPPESDYKDLCKGRARKPKAAE